MGFALVWFGLVWFLVASGLVLDWVWFGGGRVGFGVFLIGCIVGPTLPVHTALV